MRFNGPSHDLTLTSLILHSPHLLSILKSAAMTTAAALPFPSYLVSLVLPTRYHRYLPIVRWETPLGAHGRLRTRALPHEFFFYAARRSDPLEQLTARSKN